MLNIRIHKSILLVKNIKIILNIILSGIITEVEDNVVVFKAAYPALNVEKSE